MAIQSGIRLQTVSRVFEHNSTNLRVGPVASTGPAAVTFEGTAQALRAAAVAADANISYAAELYRL